MTVVTQTTLFLYTKKNRIYRHDRVVHMFFRMKQPKNEKKNLLKKIWPKIRNVCPDGFQISNYNFLYTIFRDDSLCKIIPHSDAIFNKTEMIKMKISYIIFISYLVS